MLVLLIIHAAKLRKRSENAILFQDFFFVSEKIHIFANDMILFSVI